MRTRQNDKKGFTIIELLVAILIFTIWWLSAYLLVYAAINTSIRSKNEMIAWNIAREKIELVKNIRDTNWVRVLNWDKLDNSIVNNTTGENYLTWWYYKIENYFQTDEISSQSIRIQKLNPSFTEDMTNIINPTNPDNKTMLCLDSKWRYTYDCTLWNKPTKFYAMLKIEPLKTKDSANNIKRVDDALKLTAIIYNYEKTFNRFSISTIITDWKR